MIDVIRVATAVDDPRWLKVTKVTRVDMTPGLPGRDHVASHVSAPFTSAVWNEAEIESIETRFRGRGRKKRD